MKYPSVTLICRLPRSQRLAAGLILFFPLALCQPLWPQTAGGPPPAEPAAPAQPVADTVRAALTRATTPALPPVPGAAPPPCDEPTGRPPQAATAPPPPKRASDRWWERWISGLQLFGQKSYPFRWVDVSGSENARRAFRSSAPTTANLTEVTVMGRLLNLLDLNVTLSDNQTGTDNRRVAARFHQGGADVSLGDVTASLAGNGLVPFQRAVRGVIVENQFGAQTRVTGLLAVNHAPTRQVAVHGNNTVGPYYLNAFPIELESVRVRIDETDVPRDAYTIDAYAGTITFKGDQIIPQTSVLRVSFSVRSAGVASGPLYGARASHTFRGGHVLGLTVMGQAQDATGRQGDGATGRERTDDWTEGHADSVGPYQLRYGPVVPGSEQVFVGGVLQHAGTDYLLDADRGVLQFTRLILSSEPIRVIYGQVRDGQLQARIPGADVLGPYSLSEAPVLPGSESVTVVDARGFSLPQVRDRDYRLDATAGTITFLQRPLARGSAAVVLYRPRRAAAADPAGGVVGLDGTLRLGKAASVTAQLARSGGEGASGSAMTLEGKVGLLPAKGQPRLRLGAALKSIDAGFSPIDTSSFLRNEKGLSLDGDFALNPYVRLYSRWEQGRRPLGYGAATTPDQIVDSRQSVSGLSVQYPGWPSLTIQSSRLSQEGHAGEGSQATDSVRLQYDRRHFRAAAEWARGETEGQSLAGVTGTTTGPASTDTAKLSLSYSPNDRLSFSANGVTSAIRSLTDGHEQERNARSVDLNATFRATRSLQLSADYLLSDSGTPLNGVGLAATPALPQTRNVSGLSGLPGYGSSLSGYGTGLPGGIAYGGNQRTSRLGIAYTPGSRLSLNASLDASDTELYGTTLGRSLGFSFLPLKELALTGSLSRQAARYAGIDGAPLAGSGMSSDLTYLSLRAGPFGKLLFNLDYQGLSTRNLTGAPALGSSPIDLASDVRTWTGRLSHPVGSHTAFLQYQSAAYGGANLSARKASAIAGIDLRLGRVLGLTLDMELHRYRDERRPVDSYTARILSGNLSARF